MENSDKSDSSEFSMIRSEYRDLWIRRYFSRIAQQWGAHKLSISLFEQGEMGEAGKEETIVVESNRFSNCSSYMLVDRTLWMLAVNRVQARQVAEAVSSQS